MSRSYRYPVFVSAPVVTKPQASRKLRRLTKMAIQAEKEVLPLPREVVNQYDICDWKFHVKGTDLEKIAARK